MRKLLLLLFVSQFFLFKGLMAQTYTTGAANWTSTWVQNAGSFDFTNGVGVYSFSSGTDDGAAYGRFITTDGTANGTTTTLKPGQKLTLRVGGQDGGGRTGITSGGRIGFSLRTNSSLFYDGGTASVFTRYDASSILRVEYVGGNSTAQYINSAGVTTGNMPDFTTFKSGVTYDVEVISDKEFNLVIGGTRNNIQGFANGGGAVSQVAITNVSSNMDGLFTNLAVANIPVNLTANNAETFTVTGVISNNGATVNTVQKNGVGTVILTGNNTYTGATTVNAGTLQVNKAGYTASITTTAVTVAFSLAPSNGTYAILPGALNGSQTFSATGLSANQTTSFNAATGIVTVGSITPASTTLAAFTTTYGSPSTVQTVSITGTNLAGNIITSTAPTGFELSSDGITYGATATLSSTGGTLRVRLKANANVTGTNYNGQIINLSNGTATATVTTVASGNAVSAAALTISGVSAANKSYDGLTTATLSGTPAYVGLQNGESFSVTGTPSAAFASANVNTGVGVTVSGYIAPGTNYTLSQPSGLTANITAAPLTITGITANNKPFDGNNTATLSGTAAYVGLQNGEIFSVTGTPAATFNNASVGNNKPVTVIGYIAPNSNYSISQPAGLTANIVAIGQGTADFRSKASGNFTSMGGVWEYDQGGGVFVAATQAPLSTNSVSITHSITLDQDYTVGAGKTFVLGTGGTLSVSAGRTLSVTGSANFGGNAVTFASNASGTASLGEVSGTLSGATNVTVERYIPDNGFRSWRLLSVPVTTAQTIRQAWQEGDANPNAKDNNLPNRGTQITGVFATQAAAAAAGFDSTSVNAAMLRWSGSAWANITSTNQPLNSFSSYFLYIRGERSLSVTGAVSNSSATTLRAKGTVFTGDQTNSIGANAFGLVPNLYPSAVNFTGLPRTGGVSNLFYIWDSKKLSGNSLGVYQTFSGTNSFNCLVGGGSYVLGQPNTTIESGQSFFVTSGAAGTITLRESAKISGTNGSLGFRPAGAQSKIGTRLYNSAGEMLDANTVVFDAGYDKEVAGEDAPKMGNPGANFAIERGNKLLAVEGTQPVKEGDAIQFRMWNLSQGTYSLEVEPKSFSLPEGVTAILEDSYLKASTAINLAATNKVAFTVNQDASSSSANRFKIMFVKAGPAATNSKPSYTIAPNPVEGSAMNLQLGSQPAGKYAVRIVAAGGQAVWSGTISHAGGTAAQSISLPAGLAAGTYTVEIVAPGKTRSTQTVLINRK